MQHASVKKITACRMRRMPQAVLLRVVRAKEERPLASLRKPQPPLQSTSAARSLAGTTRTPRLDQRDAVLFLPFGAAAAFAGAGHGFW